MLFLSHKSATEQSAKQKQKQIEQLSRKRKVHEQSAPGLAPLNHSPPPELQKSSKHGKNRSRSKSNPKPAATVAATQKPQPGRKRISSVTPSPSGPSIPPPSVLNNPSSVSLQLPVQNLDKDDDSMCYRIPRPNLMLV